MDPLTIMALGSTALKSIAALGQGYVGSQMDTLQKSIADENTQLLVKRAGLEATGGQELAYAAGGLEASRKVADINRTEGAATSRFAAVNLDPTVGSPLVMQGFSASQGRADLDLIAARARMQAAGALMTSAGTMAQAAGSQGQATGLGMKSLQDIAAGWFGAATAGLAGASNAFRPAAPGAPMNIAAPGYGG